MYATDPQIERDAIFEYDSLVLATGTGVVLSNI